jgi:hypothetical protein
MRTPDLDYTLDGVRHRKWVFPAYRYTHGDGVSAEQHYYAVGDVPRAVSFTVHTGRYPEGYGVTAPPSGSDMAWHHHNENGDQGGCYAMSGATCEVDGSGINAHEWYAAQPKNAEGFVADADVFQHLRDLYVRWSQP